MRAVSTGWRTAGSRARAVGGPSTGAAVPTIPVAPDAGWAAPASADMAEGKPWQNVGWTLSLVGLLVYIWSTTTYTVPLGQASMIAALVGLVLQGQPLRVPRFLAIFGVFVVWCALGYFSTSYPERVTDGLDLLWRVWLIAFVAVNSLRTRAQQRVFLFVALGAFALYPTRGAIFNYFGGYTLFGRALWNHAYGNPNDLAAFALLHVGLAMALLSREPRGWPKLAAIAGVVLLPVLVLLTQSRGAFLALAVAGVVVLVQQRRRGRTLLAVLAVGAVAAIAAPDSAWQRFGGILKLTDTATIADADEEGSAEQRFAILQIAADVFESAPIRGVGFNAYRAAHAEQAVRSGLHRVAGGERDAHNTYMRVLAETGIVGGVLYVAMLLAVIIPADRMRRRARAHLPRSSQQIFYLELGLLMFFVAGLFGSYAALATTYVLLALLWAVVRTVQDELAAVPPAARAAA